LLADALRLISDYRTRLAGIRSSATSESRIPRIALKWGKELSENCKVSRRDAERMNQVVMASYCTSHRLGFVLDLEMARR
jgi:hypothetical protein